MRGITEVVSHCEFSVFEIEVGGQLLSIASCLHYGSQAWKLQKEIRLNQLNEFLAFQFSDS